MASDLIEWLLGWRVKDSFAGRTLVFSNRPPTAGASGGAQEVIEAVSPTWWIGPEAISNLDWDKKSQLDRSTLSLKTDNSTEEKANYDVLTFSAPKTLEKRQYETIANEILWPAAHSIKPTLAGDVCYEDIENAYWNGYVRFNELGGNAIGQMVQEHNLTAKDRIWVHDYQCDNVPGAIYTRHCPFAELDFLESITFKKRDGSDIPLLEMPFFRDLMELSANRALMTFQRADDQINYIMTLAAVANKKGDVSIEVKNADIKKSGILDNLVEDIHDPQKRKAIHAALKKEITFVSACNVKAFGGKVMMLNLPVGQETINTHATAEINEQRLNKTQFKQFEQKDFDADPSLRSKVKIGDYKIFNVRSSDNKIINLTASKPEDFRKDRPLLKNLLHPIEGRNWIFSVHRNDYTKGTLTKLEAAEELFNENPELAKKTTFLFVLQPTREDIPAYKEYAEKVFAKAQALREQFGEKSVVIIPEAVKHDDILGLMRRSEMKGFMGLGHKDGHDLTVREFIDANDTGKALGVIVSSGIGAADVVGQGEKHEKAAFVIEEPDNPHEVKEALKQILDPTNQQNIVARFKAMKERSAKYNAEHFAHVLNTAYPKAMRYRFGQLWRNERLGGLFNRLFSQPLGSFPERNPNEIIISREGDGTTTRQDAHYVNELLTATNIGENSSVIEQATKDAITEAEQSIASWAERNPRRPNELSLSHKERLWQNLTETAQQAEMHR